MRTLEKRLILAIGLVVVLIALAGSLAFRAIRDNIETNLAASKSHATLGEIQSTLWTLKEAEQVRNDQLAAEGPAAIERLEKARETALRKLARLKALAPGDQRLVSAEAAVHKRINGLRKVIELRNRAIVADSEEQLATTELAQTDEIGRLLDEMGSQENVALDKTLANAESNMRFVLVCFGITGSLVVLLLVLVFCLVRHDLRVQREMHDELEKLATTDPLTGVFNRRELSRLMAVETARSERGDHPLSLLTLDVDHFKSVNDTHGHQTGDQVLRTVAARVVATVRITDIVGRTGGEEFVVVLPNTAQIEACAIAERIRAEVAAARIETPDDGTVSVTVSVGVAEKLANTPAKELVRASDQAMYFAKARGRDRVVAFVWERSTKQPLAGRIDIGEKLVTSPAV